MINKNSNINLDIVVISCDQYCDVWQLFFKNLFNNWVNCPFNVYLITNNKKFIHNRVINVNVGNDISWSDNLKKGLKSIKKKYIILFIDDLIVNETISSKYFNNISNWINLNNPNYVRLHISFYPDYYNPTVGILPAKFPYKASLMPSLWKKEILLKLLKNGESAWEFELEGSKRAFNYDKFFSVYENFISYDNSIIKGKWQRPIVKKLKISRITRPMMSYAEQIIYNLKVLRSKIINMLPNYIKLKLKKL